jgi:hypothetical protein
VLSETAAPTFGFLGEARVNVLELNLHLDRTFPATTAVAEVGAPRHE